MSKARRPKVTEEFVLDEWTGGDSSLRGLDEAYRAFTTGPQLVKSGAPELTAPDLDDNKESKGETANSGAPNVTACTLTAPTLGAPLSGAPQFPTPALGAPTVTAPVLTAPNPGAHELDLTFDISAVSFAQPQRELRPVLAESAQDGHTHGQQAVYQTIWRLGKEVAPQVRAVAIGERSLAAQVPMSYSSLQDNVRDLIAKRSIEVHSRGPNKPKVYAAFSYQEILRRRRAAGLTHIIRRTSGVYFVDPTAGALSSGAVTPGAPSSGHISSGAVTYGSSGAPNLTAPVHRSGAPKLPISGAPSSGAPLIRSEEVDQELKPSTSTALITAAISRYLTIDEDAVERIIAGCRRQVPDATDEEIAHFASITCNRVVAMRNIDNPIGMLIVQTPRFFSGAPFEQFRAERRRQREQEEQAAERLRAEAERVLADSNSSAEEKQWALQMLGSNL